MIEKTRFYSKKRAKQFYQMNFVTVTAPMYVIMTCLFCPIRYSHSSQNIFMLWIKQKL